MSLSPAIRIIAEGSGDLIKEIPPISSVPVVDDEIVLSADGGASTTYKVEKVQYILDVVAYSGESAPTNYGVSGQIEITVSEV